MTKKYLILLSLVILLLGVVGFAIYQTQKNNNPILNSPSTTSAAINNSNGQLVSSEEQPFISSTTKNQSDNVSGVASNTASNVNANTQTNYPATRDVNVVRTIFNNKFPDLNIKQINSFLAVAVKGNMQGCEETPKLNDECKYYFALYKNDAGYCGDIGDKKIQFDCYSELVFNNISSKFSNCSVIKSVFEKVNCFQNVFWAVDDLKSCSIFDSQDVQIQQACLDSTIFKLSMSQYKNNCANIKDTDIKDYCELRFK